MDEALVARGRPTTAVYDNNVLEQAAGEALAPALVILYHSHVATVTAGDAVLRMLVEVVRACRGCCPVNDGTRGLVPAGTLSCECYYRWLVPAGEAIYKCYYSWWST